MNAIPKALQADPAFPSQASALLKALGHEGRLRILIHLFEGEKTVTELTDLLSAPQTLVSGHLGRLRHEGLVSFRREGKCCVYFLKDDRVRHVIRLLGRVFVPD